MSNPTDPRDPGYQPGGQNPYQQNNQSGQPQYPNQQYPNQQYPNQQYPNQGQQSYGQYTNSQNPNSQNPNGQPQYPNQGQQSYGQYSSPNQGQQSYGQNQQGQYTQYGQQPGYGQAGQQGQYPTQQGARPAWAGGQQGSTGASSATPSSGGSNKKMLAIIGGVLALALIIGIIALATHKSSPTPVAGGGASNSASDDSSSAGSAASTADSAKGAVENYFKALQAGDANAALAFAKTDPTDKTFLTDDVLKQGMKASPITDLTVSGDDSSDFATVNYSYKLGGKQINDETFVTKSDGTWKMDDVTSYMSIYSSLQNGSPMYVAGKKVDADKIYLFPGTYPITTGSKFTTYGNGKLVVEKPGSYVSSTGLDLALSSEGKTAVINAAKTKWAWCLKQQALAPSGCGFGVTNTKGVKFVPSSIKWTVKSGASQMNQLQPKLDYNDATQAKAYVSMSMDFAAKDSSGNPYTGYSYVSEMLAKLSGDKVSVTFD